MVDTIGIRLWRLEEAGVGQAERAEFRLIVKKNDGSYKEIFASDIIRVN